MGTFDRGIYIPDLEETGWGLDVSNNLRRLSDLAFNPMAFGAAGNDSTDDTTKIQDAIDAWVAAPQGAVLDFVGKAYRITAPLVIPHVAQKTIRGGWARIRMTANNAPILRFAAQNTNTISVRDLFLQYNTQQTGSHPNSNGLDFHNPSGSTNIGHSRMLFDGLLIDRAFNGIGISGTGQIPVFASEFRSVRIANSANRGVSLVSPSAAGMPSVEFHNLYINQSGVTPAGDAIRLAGVEARFYNTTIDAWTDRVIQTSGSPVGAIFEGLHVEDHIQNGTNFITIADGPANFRGVHIHGTWNTSGALFNGLGAHATYVWDVNTNLTITSGTVSLFGGAAGTYYVGESRDVGGNVNFPSGALTRPHMRSLRSAVIPTADLPAPGPEMDGQILIEDAGAGNRNIIIYAGGQMFRINGGSAI